jgi:tRNA 2-thiouridine synthesizing protein A
MQWDIEVDCTGLLCPLPVLKAQKRLRGMAAGQVLALIATDAMAAVDVPHFCDQTGHQFLGAFAEGTAHRYLIRCKT